MKICTKCSLTKDESLFAFKNKTKGTLQAICKSCHSAIMREHYSDNKEYYNKKSMVRCTKEKVKFFNWLKTQKCCDCGICNFIVLEFDHLENKSFNIAEKIGKLSFNSIMLEVSKCDVVCANCHRIRTASRGNFYKYLK